MILGAVLAGGQSRRFGSDKALAKLNGQSLLAHAVGQLAGWCDDVVVAGRAQAPAPALCLADWPRPGMGPLGGLAAALRHAAAGGYEAVLSIGVDSPLLPANLPALLSPAPAYLAGQPVIGLWPASALPAITAILHGQGTHAMRGLAEALGAKPVQIDDEAANINTPEDLATLRRNLPPHPHRLEETTDGL